MRKTLETTFVPGAVLMISSGGRIVCAVVCTALFLLTEQASALFATTVTADGGLTASFDYRTGAEGSSA